MSEILWLSMGAGGVGLAQAIFRVMASKEV